MEQAQPVLKGSNLTIVKQQGQRNVATVRLGIHQKQMTR